MIGSLLLFFEPCCDGSVGISFQSSDVIIASQVARDRTATTTTTSVSWRKRAYVIASAISVVKFSKLLRLRCRQRSKKRGRMCALNAIRADRRSNTRAA